MAVCWPSARTCNLLPRFCRGWALAQLLPGDVVEAGLWFTLSLEGPGSSFSLATAFRFLATRHSPLLFTVDGRPCGRRPATRPDMAFSVSSWYKGVSGDLRKERNA